MIIAYFVVAVFLVIVTVIISFFAASEESNPTKGFRVFSLVFTYGLLASLFWPLIIAGIIPGIILYGFWTTARVIKNKNLDYDLEDAA